MKIFFAFALSGVFPLFSYGQSLNTEKTHFGFSIGTNKAVKLKPARPGLTIGSDVYYYPVRLAGISFTPNLSLYSYKLPVTQELYEAEQVELPLHGLLRLGKGSVRPLVAVGPNCILDVSGAAHPLAVGWDLSAGVETKFKYFILLPELRYTSLKDRKVIYFSLHFLG
jgi:hypothetical protein